MGLLDDVGAEFASAVGLSPPADDKGGKTGDTEDVMKTNIGGKSVFEIPSDQMTTIDGYTADSYFFNWPGLENDKPFFAYPYSFVVHNGEKAILQLNLPIMPSNISIQVPAAVSTTVTLNGIMEECNGAPLRHLLISGTTGVRPVTNFNGLPKKKGTAGIIADQLAYAFSNTIQAATSAAQQIQGIANQVGELANMSSNRTDMTAVTVKNDEVADQLTSYKIVHTMMRFFDWYLDAKKNNKSGKQLYLSFHMHKDKMFYDCSLNGYSIRKPPGTLEYSYTINLTAWRRKVTPNVGDDKLWLKEDVRNTSSESSINAIARVTEILRDSRIAIAATLNIFRAFSADIDVNVYGPIKEAVLLGADLANFPLALSDALDNIIKMPDAKRSLRGASQRYAESGLNGRNRGMLNYRTSNSSSSSPQVEDSQIENTNFEPDEETPESSFDASEIERRLDEIERQLEDFSGTAGELAALQAQLASLQQNANTSGGGSSSGGGESNHSGEDPFQDPASNEALFGQFMLDQLEKNKAFQKALDEMMERIRTLDSDYFEEKLQGIDSFIDTYTNSIGGQSTTVNRIQGYENVVPSRELEAEDFETLKVLNEASIAFSSFIVALRKTEGDVKKDYNTFYSDYAQGAGLDFKSGSSKFYVPFPYGATMESLSYIYFKNPDRWLEIAAINALKAPYIDEEGFIVPFQGTGSGNEFFVTNAENLYVGQVILLFSDTKKPEKRKITGIEVLSEVKSLISVDGNSDLNKYTLLDRASFRAFLPNTVNSNMLIAIPSDSPVNVGGSIKINPDNQDLSTLAYTSKADFLLSFNRFGSSDIIMGVGDIKIARGMTNLVQAANLKVLTKRGDLLHDPSYGNPVFIGQNIANVTAKDVLRSLSTLFAGDDRFTGIIAGKVRLIGPSAPISLLIGINGTNVYLPLTTQLPR